MASLLVQPSLFVEAMEKGKYSVEVVSFVKIFDAAVSFQPMEAVLTLHNKVSFDLRREEIECIFHQKRLNLKELQAVILM